MLASPSKDSYDVWVNKKNDLRWALHTIEHLEEYHDIPIVISAELRLLPFSHPAYRITV